MSCSFATPAPSPVPVRSTARVATSLAATLLTKTISLVAHRGGAGLAAENTLSTSQSYREPIPTFTQVLDLAKSKNVQLQVEIKVDADQKRYPGIERHVLEEITARDMLDRVNILALEFDTLKEIRTINPRVKTVSLMGEEFFRSMGNRDPAALVDDVISFSDGIAVNKDFLSARLVEAAHQRNMLVGVWTVDTASEIQKFIEIGVDSVTTNRPDIFKAMLGR